MKRFLSAILVVAVALISSACSSVAPAYSPSVENAQTLKNYGTPATVGQFTAEPSVFHGNESGFNVLRIRANSMRSPIGNTFGDYMGEALKQELLLAKLLATDSNVEISGVFLKNDISAGGFTTGTVNISVRFIVKKKGQVAYDAIKSIDDEFPTGFAAATAIPHAVQHYSVAVQKLLASLYADPAFLSALK